MQPPPRQVVEAFGAPWPARPLSPPAWRAGGVVLKPLDGPPAVIAWQARVLRGVADGGLRVAPPLAARDGRLVVGGWTAWPLLAGKPTARWADVSRVAERLDVALSDAPPPPPRDDVWSRADRVEWDTGSESAEGVLGALLAAREPVDLPDQAIHGDLTGNVLVEPGRPPAVIDLSPYWRPAGYAAAIAAVDLATWEGAGEAPLRAVADGPFGAQLLVRAVLFRLESANDRRRLEETAAIVLTLLPQPET